MAIIAQRNLFSWKEIDDLGDLERLRLLLEHLPDEELMRTLEKHRGRGRDDYPVRATWNSLLAGIVYQHPSIEGLRRELSRNGQLRDLCGFDPFLGENAIPTSSAYTNLLGNLMRFHDQVDRLFDELVNLLHVELPGFGESLAIDGKAINTHARPMSLEKKATLARDGRRDLDADFGKKKTIRKDKKGNLIETVKRWFGYKLHLIVESDYELPVAYELARASKAEQPIGRKLLTDAAKRVPGVIESAQVLSGDKGYDDTKLIVQSWNTHRIKPVIDIRMTWRDDETRLVEGTENIVYDNEGAVYCYCLETGEQRSMAYGGFEKDRETLKYRCPARHYGIECASAGSCPAKSGTRIPISEDRRIFTPLARSTHSWTREYKKRTAVERVNSRIDVSFGFENHLIRGKSKMKLRCDLAFIVMLAMALGRARENRLDLLRSLVKVA
ncbi:transposase [Candidatus Hydrogenedentota bacterium]